MHAIEEKTSFSNELAPITPSALLFKVVVNNYKQKAERPEHKDDDDNRTISAELLGLPPQPDSYLKYPNYDWL